MQHPKIFRRASRGGGYRFLKTLHFVVTGCYLIPSIGMEGEYTRHIGAVKVGGYMKMRNGLVLGRRGEAPKDFDFFI